MKAIITHNRHSSHNPPSLEDKLKSNSDKTSNCIENISTEIEELNSSKTFNDKENNLRRMGKMDALIIKIHEIEYSVHIQNLERIRDDLQRIRDTAQIDSKTQINLRLVILNAIAEINHKARPLLHEAIHQYEKKQQNLFLNQS